MEVAAKKLLIDSFLCHPRLNYTFFFFKQKTAYEIVRLPNDKEPLALLAFKIMDDPFVGTITFCRIYSGTLLSGTGAANSPPARREGTGRMLLLHPTNGEATKEANAGAIAPLPGRREAPP